ncbi:hypothetical protein [Oceanibacterium hippocampi]|uniref:5' nucleotidase, deoxy (Pyrimidine), cytosolic type C protein (NT5C) n=1 Tax=Oceanibacterium hippocampi TaxID=745714 RepID=A0A1Y5SM11_9PROT|nr:hypothetical protein [Oceanibacterium hippocampi]SLN43842.1 hypothetical protein OCH7691_01838 [Oceanibacterium hippocampi]
MSTTAISDETARQIDAIRIEPGRPLVITDADEVLFLFLQGFADYLEGRSLYFDWSSYALTGNIRRRADDLPIEATEVRGHIYSFFENHTEALPTVPGAAAGLAALSQRAQIVVLSNLPHAQGEARRRALAANDMPYPLITNSGMKGEAVRRLSALAAAPTVFIDDSPLNLASVKESAGHVDRLHFIGDPRLARLLGPAEESHARHDDWPALQREIEARIPTGGS